MRQRRRLNRRTRPLRQRCRLPVRFAGLSGDQASDMIERARRASEGAHHRRRESRYAERLVGLCAAAGQPRYGRRQVAELRALGDQDLYILQDDGPNHAVSLGVFKTETSATNARSPGGRKGVRARVAAQQ